MESLLSCVQSLVEEQGEIYMGSGDFCLHIGLVYVPPHGSSSEKQNTVSSYEVLQQGLAHVLADNGVALVAGDFNARTRFTSGTCMEVFSNLLNTSLQPEGQLCEHLKFKTSDDKHTCAFGKTLLDLCEMSELCILNGCAPGETNGRMTCNTAQGSSVVDYFLTSASGKNSGCNGCT